MRSKTENGAIVAVCLYWFCVDEGEEAPELGSSTVSAGSISRAEFPQTFFPGSDSRPICDSRDSHGYQLLYRTLGTTYTPLMHSLAPLFALLGLATTSHASAGNTTATLAECLAAADVPVDGTGTPEYELDVSSFNLRLPYTPVSVVAATTVKHIQDSVTCARELGIKATAKCGGHSYASFGLGGEDGHLVIEMSRMNKVVLDNTTGIATAEGGTRLGHLAWELYDQGKRAISHGTCPG